MTKIATGVGNAVKGLFTPKVVTDRDQSAELFSRILSGGLSGGNVGGLLSQGFSLPGYTGQFGQGILPAQQGALDAGNSAFNQFMSGDQGASALSALSGIAGGNNDVIQRILQLSQSGNNNDIMQRLLGFGVPSAPSGLSTLGGTASAGESGLAGLGGGFDMNTLRQFIGAQNPYLSQLASAGQIDTPERQLLLQAASQDPTRRANSYLGGAQDIIGQLLPTLGGLAGGTGGPDIGSIFDAISGRQQMQQGRDIRDLREQFSAGGGRFGTDLAGAESLRMAQGAADTNAQLATLLPQILGIQQQGQGMGIQGILQAAAQSGQLGNIAGQLGLGRQSNVLSGTGAAGNLGLNSGQALIQALTAATQGQQAQTTSQQGAATDVIQQLVQQLTGAGQLSNQRQGVQQSALSSLGGLNLSGNDQLLRAILGAGDLGTQQAGQQGNILNQLLGTQTGAAQSLPGAFSMLAGLPGTLAQGNYNLNEGARSALDTILGRQYSDFTRTQSLLPLLFQFMGQAPQDIGKSPWDTAMGAGTGILGLLTGIKGLSG